MIKRIHENAIKSVGAVQLRNTLIEIQKENKKLYNENDALIKKIQAKEKSLQRWKINYLKMKWKVFKQGQRIWVLNKKFKEKKFRYRAGKLNEIRKKIRDQLKIREKRIENKRTIYRNYKIPSIARFSIISDKIYKNIGISSSAGAFLLWASRFEWFDKRDYEKDFYGLECPGFYWCIQYLKKLGLVEKVIKSSRITKWRLTYIGFKMADRMGNKIQKYFYKRYEEEC